MPNWNDIGKEIEDGQQAAALTHDTVLKKYLTKLNEYTSRNVIIYYSGWLQSAEPLPPLATSLTDFDITGFMGACNGLEHDKGLDLLLHTPGGGITATQGIVSYLHNMFDDIRVVVPQLAMSAGTMVACSAKSILMGKQSSLGPIDPQMNGMPAHGILEEFNQAHKEIASDPSRAMVWQPILAKYRPTFIGECQKAIDLSKEMVTQWLTDGMFKSEDDPAAKANAVVAQLGDPTKTKLHSRHISADECAAMGLKIEKLEDDQELQDAVLSVHHACMHMLSSTQTVKIIRNHHGQTFNVRATPRTA